MAAEMDSARDYYKSRVQHNDSRAERSLQYHATVTHSIPIFLGSGILTDGNSEQLGRGLIPNLLGFLLR